MQQQQQLNKTYIKHKEIISRLSQKAVEKVLFKNLGKESLQAIKINAALLKIQQQLLVLYHLRGRTRQLI